MMIALMGPVACRCIYAPVHIYACSTIHNRLPFHAVWEADGALLALCKEGPSHQCVNVYAGHRAVAWRAPQACRARSV